MANLITALQQKPSVSSANYVAEFWCLNHYDMVGTGRERTVRTQSPKARSWLGFQSFEDNLGSAPLRRVCSTASQNGVFQEIQTNPWASCGILFQSWDFPALWSRTLPPTWPTLFSWRIRTKPTTKKSFTSHMHCGVDWAFLPPMSVQLKHVWISKVHWAGWWEGWWLCESTHTTALQKLQIITTVKLFARLASWNLSL